MSILFFLLSSVGRAEILFSESFENNNFSSRGWYDGNPTANGIVSGGQSGNCLKWAWAQNSVTPSDFTRSRRLFTATDSLSVSFYVKFESNWRGSQVDYHPHIINILSNLDGDWDGPSWSYLDTYIEFMSGIGAPYNINPQIALQDGKRINVAACPGNPPCDATNTENRAIGGCNGCAAGSACGNISDCYRCASGWCNGRIWKPSNILGKDQWVKVETYFKMNTVSQNVGQANGVLKMWINGMQIMNYSNLIYRTNQDATKKFRQFIFGPWIEVGAPIAQTMWLDELVLSTDEPYVSGDISPPAPPQNLFVN